MKAKSIAEYPQIHAQWHPTKNRGLTPGEVMLASTNEYWWYCPEAPDHQWKSIPRNRLKSGCPFCAGKRVAPSTSLAALHPELSRQWHPTKNGALSPKRANPRSVERVWWKCAQGDDHEWPATIRSRVGGASCPFCRAVRASSTHNLASARPEVARLWHPRKNGRLTPSDVTPGSERVVWWRCEENTRHVWQAKVCLVGRQNRKSMGCPFCAGVSILRGDSLYDKRPDLREYWDVAKNGRLTARDVTCGSSQRVYWRCPIARGHRWRATPVEVTQKQNPCPFCNNRRASFTNSLAAKAPAIAAQWHPDRNRGTPSDVVVSSKRRVWWKCPEGPDHEWDTLVVDRTRNGTRCPFCINRRWSVTNNLEAVSPRLAHEWHPTRNGKKRPRDVIRGSSYQAWWRCVNGHVWRAAVSQRVRGSDCPACGRRPRGDRLLE